MELSAVEDRFNSAVEIIKSLPKSGSIQTSNETKLKFYSFFKQATEGPCELPKPGFWDIVNRAKWDAWSKLGNMSKEEAMRKYVQEFVKIIQETPLDSLDDPSVVNEYLGMMGPYIEFAPEEIKKKHMLLNGNANKSLNNNLEDYKEVPARLPPFLNNNKDDKPDLYSSSLNGHSINGGNESDSDIFSDTLEGVNDDDAEEANNDTQNSGPSITNLRGGDHRLGTGNDNSSPAASGGRTSQPARQSAGSSWPFPSTSNNSVLGSAGGSRRSGGGVPAELAAHFNEQLALAVIRLQHGMDQVLVRLGSLEETLLTERRAISQVPNRNQPGWSIFGMSPKLAALLFVWPFIVQFLVYYIRKKQRSP